MGYEHDQNLAARGQAHVGHPQRPLPAPVLLLPGAARTTVVAVTRARGGSLQNALARWLAPWWPHAESAGAGRQGTDVLGTPGVVWECKTADDFKRDFKPAAWIAQAKGHARGRDIPVVVYFPRGIGEANIGNALTIMPLHVQMRLLQDAGYAPHPAAVTIGMEDAG
jgi:hypothetical protein